MLSKLFGDKKSKTKISIFLMMIVSLSLVVVLVMALHTSSSVIDPVWTQGSLEEEFGIDVNNEGEDSIEWVRITKPPEYGDIIECIAPANWGVGVQTIFYCQFYTTTDTIPFDDFRNFKVLLPTASVEGTYSWQVKTKDTIESYYIDTIDSKIDTTEPEIIIDLSLSDSWQTTSSFTVTASIDDGTISSGVIATECEVFYNDILLENKITYDGSKCSGDVSIPEGTTQGAGTLKVTISDAVENEGSDTIPLNFDEIPPKVTIDPLPTLTNILTQTITGTFTEDNLDTITVNGELVTDIVGNAYSAEITLSEGPNPIKVIATDKAGNIGTASSNIELDTTVPTITDVFPLDESYVATNQPTISATLGDDSGIDIESVMIKVNGEVISSAEITETSITYIPDTPLSEGPFLVEIYAEDNAGNSATSSTSFIIDITYPIITIDEVATLTNIPTQTITGTFDELNIDTITVNGELVTDIVGNAYSAEITLSEGSNPIEVIATDKAGNTDIKTTNIELDTTAPTITDVSPLDESYVNTNQPTISATLGDDSGIDIESVMIKVNGEVISSAEITETSITYIPDTPLSEGPFLVEIYAEDNAGNSATSSTSFIIDSINPEVYIDPIDALTNMPTQTITGTFIEDNIDTITVNNIAVTTLDIEAGTYSIELDLSEGPNPIEVIATDKAGNIGLAPIVDITLDSKAPTTSDTSIEDIQVPPYTVTIIPQDAEPSSGLTVTYYCVDPFDFVEACIPNIPVVGPIGFSTRGTNYLRYYSVDLAGNKQETVSKTININQLPEVENVFIFTSNPLTTDDLKLGAYSLTDEDAEHNLIVLESNSLIEWYKDDIHQENYDGLTILPSSATLKGELWHAIITPKDGLESGTSVGGPQLAVEILNTAPTQPIVDITPDELEPEPKPSTNDDLTCSITTLSEDDDGDGITYSYAWYKWEDLQTGLITNTVSAGLTAKGEVWKCVVTPNDGEVDGTSAEDSVIIKNTAPTQPSIELTPYEPYVINDLTCLITADSTDADGDIVEYSYAWYKGKVLQTETTNTVSFADTSKGEIWSCIVIPNDEEGSGDQSSLSNPVTIGILETNSIELTATKLIIDADGASTSEITAELRDGKDALVPEGTEVTISTNKGSLDKVSATTTEESPGIVEFTLTSAISTGIAEITVESYEISRTIDITFKPGSFGMIKLDADGPASVPADGKSTLDVIAQIADSYGNDIASAGVEILFETTDGTFKYPEGLDNLDNIKVETDMNGQAKATLIAPEGAYGTATITSKKGLEFETIEITLTSPDFDDKVDLIGGKWNLISVPKNLDNANVEVVFESSDKVYYYDTETKIWLYYILGSGTLTNIDPLNGYWVKPDVDKTLTLIYKPIGDIPPLPPSQELVAGWNLIGHGSEITMSVEDALSAIDDKYAFVLQYNPEGEWKTYSVSGIKQFTTMRPGYGYWIFMKESGIYAIGI